jgi:Polyketide cyclase / dehydrase and lipid transport
MGRYRITRRIDARPDQVYRAFTDPALVADWMDASGVREATGPLEVVGTRYTLVIRGPHRLRSEVVRAEPGRVHETVGRGPFGSYRMVATLSAHDGATDLDLLTEYALPLGPIGRWVDRRWIDHEPRTNANREVDRLVTLVTGAV